jgi:hypothetical protein
MPSFEQILAIILVVAFLKLADKLVDEWRATRGHKRELAREIHDANVRYLEKNGRTLAAQLTTEGER